MTSRIRVVKVGGSLLPQGPAPLRRWFAEALRQTPSTSFVLIVGGGAAVDALRRLDARAPLGEETAHWLAIEQMAINARVVAAWLNLPVVEGRLETLGESFHLPERLVVYDARRFLREVEPRFPGDQLPIGWSTTSDSIAARVAGALGAGLTLLKSSAPPTPGGWATLAEAGYVDAAFPAMAAQVSSVDCVALPSLSPSSPASCSSASVSRLED